MAVLEKDSPLSLTYQLTQILRQRILTEYSPGNMFSTEKEISAEFDVSSITVRNALDTLVNEGLICRKRGKGTYIAEKLISSSVEKLLTITQLLKGQKVDYTIKLITMEKKKVNAVQSKIFGLPENEEVNKISRCRLVENEVYTFENSYIPQKYCENIFETYTSGSLYEFMNSRYGIVVAHSEARYTAIGLDNQQAEIFNLPPNTPAMLVKDHIFDQHNRVVGIEFTIFRADKYEIVLNRRMS